MRGIGSKIIVTNKSKCFILETYGSLCFTRSNGVFWLSFSLRNEERYVVESKLIVMYQNIALVPQET